MTQPHSFSVHDYARSLESGWLGKILSIEDDQYGTPTARMVGVDGMAHAIMGMSAEESLSFDDIQWFALADLLPVKSVSCNS